MRSGLRARVTAGFTAGALALSTLIALVSYQIVRESLLAERERTAVRAAYYNAAIVRAGVAGNDDPDFVEALRVLDTGTSRRSVLRHDGDWYARDADAGLTDAIPVALQRLVGDGRPGTQRVRVDGRPAIVVGVPLDRAMTFYSVDSLQELDRTFDVLGLTLAIVALLVGAGGAALGWYAARYVMRPLASVAGAAQDIAAGDLGARLNPATEPDLERLTTSFNAMVEQLERRLERDRRFAADVSHELRSPLQTLAAAASVLARRRDRLDERSAAAAGLVTDEVDRFSRLVNDLIELARGDQPVTRARVDVAELARQSCRRLGLPERLVHAEGASAAAWQVDRRRVEQVLGNLLDNAVRHGGGPCAVRLGSGGGRCWIEVDDEGPGVSPADRDVIFERFVRGRVASARGGSDGTGLGLALVAQHAAAHGGHAAVLDRPGGGARFRVELTGCAP
jgi:signal transduction histidine kinase